MKVSTLCSVVIASSFGFVKESGAAGTAPVITAGYSVADKKPTTAAAFFRNSKNKPIIEKNNKNFHTIRGGACSDSDPALFIKIGIQTIAESAGLLGILIASINFSDKLLPSWSIFNLPFLELIASFLIIFGSSIIGAVLDGGLSVATNQALNPSKVAGDPNWYSNLKKPVWNPPGWAFPIMWLIVSKPTQLCALSRILKFGMGTETVGVDGGVIKTTTIPFVALAVYTTHLALGDAWNKVFFGLECIGRGTAVITVFFSFLLASTYLFYNIDAGAGYYMLPTCGWVFVATALQWSIYLKNKKK